MAPSLVETIPESLVIQHIETKPAPISKISPCCPDVTGIEHNGIDMSKVRNPSLQVTAEHKIKMVDAPVNRPGPREVLLHIKATGICG